jgi:tRNA threonylcarbamoyladenosine biosynthesis protein TsaE
MDTFISHSPEETAALGEQWGRDAKPGCVIGLTGDLGAGKTQLVKGIARGLGITARIQSPTFALVNEYREGRLPMAHLDLYRLDTPQQILSAGLEEYFANPPGVTVIEWCERWPDFNPPSAIRNRQSALRLVRIEQTGETERRITHEDFGG